MMKFLGMLLVFCICVLLGFSQEKTDTLSFNPNYKPQVSIPFMMDMSFSENFPLSGDYNTHAQMIKQVFSYGKEDLNAYHFYFSPNNSFYYYSKNGYTFWQNSNPLNLGFSYHFDEPFGLKNFDFFMDGSALLYHEYEENIPGVFPLSEPAVLWEVGAGIGYKITPQSTIFIKSSVHFHNLNPYGSSHVGGLNVKF